MTLSLPTASSVAPNGARSRIKQLRQIMGGCPHVAALPRLSQQVTLTLEPLKIGAGSLRHDVVAPRVRLHRVPCVRVLYRISEQGDLAIIEVTGQQRQRLLDTSGFYHFPFYIRLQISNRPLDYPELIDKKVRQVAVILFAVQEAARVLGRRLSE